MKNNFFIFFCLLSATILSLNGTKDNSETPCPEAKKLERKHFDNLYQVNDELYRSDQPGSKGMKELQELGIKTVINLRNIRCDNNEARKTNLKLEHISINTRRISYEEIIASLKKIKESEKPVLVHCWHGSDRTGCIVAAYRMCACGWTKENAIREFLEPPYGYHQNIFPNILRLLNSIDVEKLKKDVNAKDRTISR